MIDQGRCVHCGQEVPYPYIRMTGIERKIWDYLFARWQTGTPHGVIGKRLNQIIYGDIPNYQLRNSRAHVGNLRNKLGGTDWTISYNPYRLLYLGKTPPLLPHRPDAINAPAAF